MAARNKKKSGTNGVRATPTNSTELDDSPLKLFGEAKDKINCLFQRLDKCVGKASTFYSDPQLDPEVVKDVDTGRLKRLSDSIGIIRAVLSRNQMKVAFFGRTSNGKSTVINTILHDKVLPMGYGFTTACFLQIEGNQDDEAFLEVLRNGQGDGRKPIQSVNNIANALNSGSVEFSTLVKVHWPISKCPLLKYDVVLVDSPGVDVEEDLDEWIDKHCHDADVFVLVSNAESTLNNAEKNFFHKVSEKLSKPNIFILNNRWDCIADGDPDNMSVVKSQHIERAIRFLSEELKISTPEEAQERTFFVSARETLQTRTNSGDSHLRREGYSDRNDQFISFERKFEESLSKSAVKTKFKTHTDKGRQTIRELTTILTSTQSLVTSVSQKRIFELQQCEDHCQRINNLFYANESGLQQQLQEIKKRIQIMADTELDNEIRRLSRVVEDFDHEFSPNPAKIALYKERLYQHVEESLSENVKSKITTVINKHVNPFNRVMCDISLLLPTNRQQVIRQVVTSQSYIQDDLFDLRIYRKFYTDFHEDLEFRFSLSLVNIMRNIQSRFYGKAATLDSEPSASTDVLSVVERFMLYPPQSPTTIGSLAVCGMLVRTVGLKVIVITSAVCGALYAYEYLTWTNAAKERTFRAQYVKYARKGLQDCVPVVSQHIANSIEQKMSATFQQVKEEVDNENKDLVEKTGILRSSLDKLRICDEFTRQLLGDNDVLLTELMAFATTFLGN